jgi:hypothetical protein
MLEVVDAVDGLRRWRILYPAPTKSGGQIVGPVGILAQVEKTNNEGHSVNEVDSGGWGGCSRGSMRRR